MSTYSRTLFDDAFEAEKYFDHVRTESGKTVALPTEERPAELKDGLSYPDGVPGAAVLVNRANLSDQRALDDEAAARAAAARELIAREIDTTPPRLIDQW